MSKPLIVAASVVVLLSAACTRVPEGSPEMSVYGPQADFVFRGQVRILHTSTIDSPDAESMAVVQVVDVVQAPPSLAGSVGRDVTVQFPDIGSVSADDDLLLFTNIAVLGNEIGLTAIASLAWDEGRLSTAALQGDLEKAVVRHEDEVLRQQVRSSDVVVVGAVIRTAPLDTELVRDSEHDPMWTEAVVQVEEQLKGEPRDTVSFVFAASRDVAWFAAPKLTEGDRGVFLLQTRENVTQLKDRLALVQETEFRVDKAAIDRIREHARGVQP